MTSLPILQTIPSGSSGTGISYYSEAARCSRRLRLNKMFEVEGTRPQDTGKIFHALCEVFYDEKKRAGAAFQLDDLNYGEAADEAKRLFLAYSERFAPTDFAKVLATELLLPAEGDTEARAIIETAVGVSPFTCRIDMVVEVDARSAEVLYKKRGLVLDGYGTYLWDWKTKGQKGSSDDLIYRFSPQFIAYQLVWNALHPDNPCKGMIADVIVGHKKLEDKSFYSVLCPPPTMEQAMGLRRWLQAAQRNAATDDPNWLSCFEFGRPCPHLLSGNCTRN